MDGLGRLAQFTEPTRTGSPLKINLKVLATHFMALPSNVILAYTGTGLCAGKEELLFWIHYELIWKGTSVIRDANVLENCNRPLPVLVWRYTDAPDLGRRIESIFLR